MISENTEPKDDQIIITSPTSTINHTVEQITNKWKQISLQGLDITPQEMKLKIATPLLHSRTQRVNRLLC
jgi:muramoyltetrapeptide carboxypeptidase LdcA involved in peptidoglycan recycling